MTGRLQHGAFSERKRSVPESAARVIERFPHVVGRRTRDAVAERALGGGILVPAIVAERTTPVWLGRNVVKQIFAHGPRRK